MILPFPPRAPKGGSTSTTPNRVRIAVAMSGGVDSSVVAYLLAEEGFDVIGVTMLTCVPQKTGGREGSALGRCSVPAVERARRVAKKLGIPFYEFNLGREFSREVVDYFCSEYLRGRTPNPCILCNEKLKFGRLWESVHPLGAELLATGHYARVQYDQARGRYLLRKGVDARKDQSYVLFSLSQGQLSRARFPLGNLEKDHVRAVAQSLGLSISGQAESQEICFIRGDDYRCYLRSRLVSGEAPGLIVDRQGRVLGTHQGISAFTIGQRRGLGIAAGHPLYVIDLDWMSNRVVVGPEGETFQDRCVASGVRWMAIESLTEPETVVAKIRYTHPGAEARIEPIAGGRVMVRFKHPQKAVTPGQAVVFYQGDGVLGGGWIEGGERG